MRRVPTDSLTNRLLHQGTGDGQLDHDGQIPAKEHGQACGDVPEVGVICQPLKAGAVVGRGRGVLIQHLAQAVEARVGDARQAAGGGRPPARRRPGSAGDG